ncbi:hypothetical protein [Cupriavidus pampae]|uniref:Uncharacterized protein n=1 Tax=Cupriavidus pampae TaxID=659251 RepID=A0ABM8XP93_9BURK|nr:hypothetical protein [Cupriavidus pampae]CAG9182060.1 hypothetical protein LMG32289_05025 [Cupriavidus pampae]
MRSHRLAVMSVTVLLAWPALHATAGPPDAAAPQATTVVAATASASAESDSARATASATAIATSSAKPNVFGSTARAVTSEKLDGVRGGAETVVNDMKLHGTVADNAAINVRTGSNVIAEGSFSNSAGLPTVIQNTGSNVLIQNATILNVQFK